MHLSGEAASVDHVADSVYPAEIKTFIMEKGYSHKQVFRADETALFWKRMLAETNIKHQKA